ncbi:hypothetical protein ACWV95_09765 [Streptomyces albus]
MRARHPRCAAGVRRLPGRPQGPGGEGHQGGAEDRQPEGRGQRFPARRPRSGAALPFFLKLGVKATEPVYSYRVDWEEPVTAAR